MAEANPLGGPLAAEKPVTIDTGTKHTTGGNTTPPTASQDGVLPGHNGLSSPRH
jgi:hypothetical protein